MHPISGKKFFGPNGIAISLNNGSLVPGYIVQQLGNVRFVVSDSLGNKEVARLAQTPAEVAAIATPAALGTFTVVINSPAPASLVPAVFTAIYEVKSAAPAAPAGSAGTGYAAGDTLHMWNNAVLSVSAVDGNGAITGLTVTAPGSFTEQAAAGGAVVAPMSSTSVHGTGAKVALKLTILTLTPTQGAGYAVGQHLVFPNLVATTPPVATISAVSNTGAPTAVTLANAGTGITTVAHNIMVATGVEHVAKFDSKLLETVEGNRYRWTLSGNAVVPSALTP